jgi:hypothetical protein
MTIKIFGYIFTLTCTFKRQVKEAPELPPIIYKRTLRELKYNLLSGEDFEFVSGFTWINGECGKKMVPVQYQLVE